MDGLNEAQRRAVETLKGPLLVLAGAGTGKTRVITYRIRRLIQSGVPAGRIWGVTFTNKAAKEMRSRLRQMLGPRSELPLLSTFHAYCVQILRRQIHHLGYPSRFPIYDQGDQESLARRVLRSLKMPETTLRPSDLLYFIGSWKSRGLTPDQALREAQSDREHLAAAGYRRYQKALEQAGAVDFDDLLLCTVRVFEAFPEVRAEEAGRFDHILVDEYQDTNGPQYRLVTAMAQDHRNLCVVGDDDQSIYAWRGADVRHILRFTADWPDATVVRLEENYRCAAPILRCANRLIAYNSLRTRKQLKPTRGGKGRPRVLQFDSTEQEAEGVIQAIAGKIISEHRRPGDFAILFRTNEQPRAFEMALRKAKIPYVLVGTKSFYDRREIKDVLAYLRLVDRPHDEESLRRILNVPARGLGEKSVDRLLQAATSSNRPLWDVLQDPSVLTTLPHAAQRGAQSLVQAVDSFHRRRHSESLAALTRELLERIEYRREIEHVYPREQDREQRWQTLEELVNALAAYEQDAASPTLGAFLDEMALGLRDVESDKEAQLAANAVVLMTLHSAKGLEFPVVYLVGMEEGILPHHRSLADGGDALDEERRLCYVGITRAQEELVFSLALSRRKWGKARPTIPSPFLYEALGIEKPIRESSSKSRKDAKK